MVVQTALAVLGLVSLFPAGCMHERDVDGKKHWKLALHPLCHDSRQPGPALRPVEPVKPAGACTDDGECTPWQRRLDSREFDAGVTHQGERLRMGRPLPAGQMRGYDGRVYQKKTCLVHVEGPRCNCDLWEPVPADGSEYTPDLFSKIYHENIADFHRFR
jgi:hypothetical protein